MTKPARVFQAEDIRGQEQEPSTRLPPPANGEHCLDDAEAQNSLPKCLTFPHSGSSCGRENSRGKAKNPFPPEKDFRFAESVLKPHALPEYLDGRTLKEKHPSLFQKNYPRQIRNARSVFFRGCWRTRQCVGLFSERTFSFASPRTWSVPHHLFWKWSASLLQ